MPRSCLARMSRRSWGGGTPTSTSLSNLPGRRSAASSESGRLVAALSQQPAPRPQQPPPPRAVASRDTLSLLFDSLSRDDSEQQTRIGRMVDGTSSRMRATSEQQRLLREQHTLARARQKGMLWSGRLQLPNAHQVCQAPGC